MIFKDMFTEQYEKPSEIVNIKKKFYLWFLQLYNHPERPQKMFDINSNFILIFVLLFN